MKITQINLFKIVALKLLKNWYRKIDLKINIFSKYFAKAQVFRSSKAFAEKSRWKLNFTTEGLHFQEPKEMTTKFGILCVQIVN